MPVSQTHTHTKKNNKSSEVVKSIVQIAVTEHQFPKKLMQTIKSNQNQN